MSKKMDRYIVKKHFKDTSKRSRIVEKGLTKEDAQKMVEDDLKINPKALTYMLTYDKME